MKNKRVISHRLEVEQLAALEAVAASQGMTRAEAINAALEAYAKDHGQHWPQSQNTHGGKRTGAGRKHNE